MLPLGQILPDLYISSDCLIDSADHFEEILFSYIRSHSRRSLADLPEVVCSIRSDFERPFPSITTAITTILRYERGIYLKAVIFITLLVIISPRQHFVITT